MNSFKDSGDCEECRNGVVFLSNGNVSTRIPNGRVSAWLFTLKICFQTSGNLGKSENSVLFISICAL